MMSTTNTAGHYHSSLCLDVWQNGVQKVHFTFGQLAEHAQLKDNAPELFVHFLGEQTIQRWFPARPADDTTVPRQAALLLWIVLQNLRANLLGQDKVRKETTASIAVHIANALDK